jgi:hypothetical protein
VFIELIDLLRCVNPHADSWLVASFRNITDRFVLEGTLGCPICSSQYEIAGGVADFSQGAKTRTAERRTSANQSEDLAMRIGAFLNATQAGATIVLGGSWADASEELARLADVRVIALNAGARVTESERVGLVRVGDRIPLASSSVHGAAFDDSFSRDAIEAAAAVVKPGGRIVAPSSNEPLPQFNILARDTDKWVAEKQVEVHPLTRARPAR